MTNRLPTRSDIRARFHLFKGKYHEGLNNISLINQQPLSTKFMIIIIFIIIVGIFRSCNFPFYFGLSAYLLIMAKKIVSLVTRWRDGCQIRQIVRARFDNRERLRRTASRVRYRVCIGFYR